MTKRRVRVVVSMAMLTSLLWMTTPAVAAGCDPDHVTQWGKTWRVTPTGTDDTANIQCAIDAAAGVHGSTVQLMAGRFRAAMLTMTDMVSGTFQGAGKAITTLEALPDLECQKQRMEVGHAATWILVEQGEVTVRDITLEVTDPTPCAITFEDQSSELSGAILQFGGGGVVAGSDCGNPPVYEVNGRVQDVRLLAPDLSEGEAVMHGVWVSGSFHCDGVSLSAAVTGDVEVVSSTFVNSTFAVAASGFTDGTITMGGSPWDANTVIGPVGFFGQDLDGSAVVVSHNDLSVTFGGVFGVRTHDVLVHANVISGTGLAAVYHGIANDASGGWTITGNDVTGFEGTVADYWLGAGTFADRLATNDATDTVLDEGTDNTIVRPAIIPRRRAGTAGQVRFLGGLVAR